MSQKIAAPKGTNDILPKDIPIWEKIEENAKQICKQFGYEQIRTPAFESTALFKRGVGETTDIVNKEMYTFLHRGKESLTLKPEGTASVVRAYIEHGMASNPQPVKLFYITRCFRCENPQKGRYRQFHQFGIEALGSSSPMMDAEVISLADQFIRSFGIKNVELRLNSVGCPSCRSDYQNILREYLSDKLDRLCEDCKDRYEKNPMRIIDCKNETCKAAIQDVPYIMDHLCDTCSDHFTQVKDLLDSAQIVYRIDPTIVRGLDYYTNTAFEFVSNDLGAQSTVCGGGRYNGLVEELGGKDTPGIGFGMGIERLILLMEAQDITFDFEQTTDLYIAPMGYDAQKIAFDLTSTLRESGMIVETDMMDRSLKAQMKYADKINAGYVMIIGEDEITAGNAVLRNMKTKEQAEIPYDDAEMITKTIREQ